MVEEFFGFSLDTPLIMGIVNVTPDSFSDGGETFDHDAAIERGLQHIKNGADLVDVGGQSSRPGSVAVHIDEELRRVVPVVKGLSEEGVIVSIDTYRSEVMAAALDGGAQIVNDISALSRDSKALEVVVSRTAFVILMHMGGDQFLQVSKPAYRDVVNEVKIYLKSRIKFCVDGGLCLKRICIDPGIGFNKSTNHNFDLLNNLNSFLELGCPIMIGVSRKFGLNKETNKRLEISINLALKGLDQGVKILRVHDVEETKKALDNWLLVRYHLKQ